MALIVKIMHANRGNDEHPRHGHDIWTEVTRVQFFEPTRRPLTDPSGDPGDPPMIEMDTRIGTTRFRLEGNVYVMNEAGKTIDHFEVDYPLMHPPIYGFGREMANRMSAVLKPEQVDWMVSRFLGWHLPENFKPDDGISFKRLEHNGTPYPMPTGTNLFTASEAAAMVCHMVEGMPS